MVDKKDFMKNQLMEKFFMWDIFPENAYEAASHAKVLEKDLLTECKEELSKIKPMKAVFDKNFIKRIDGGLFVNQLSLHIVHGHHQVSDGITLAIK